MSDVVKLNYSTKEAAAVLSVSERTVRNWIERRGLPSIKVGGRRLIRVRDLGAWNEAQRDPRVESARQAS